MTCRVTEGMRDPDGTPSSPQFALLGVGQQAADGNGCEEIVPQLAEEFQFLFDAEFTQPERVECGSHKHHVFGLWFSLCPLCLCG